MEAVDFGEESKADARQSPKAADASGAEGGMVKPKKAPAPGYDVTTQWMAKVHALCIPCYTTWLSIAGGPDILGVVRRTNDDQFRDCKSLAKCWDCGLRIPE